MAYATATQEMEDDGARAGSANEDLPRVRDTALVPSDLELESFAIVDTLDSRAEGQVLTPGRDLYASHKGGSLKTSDKTLHGVGEDTDRRLCGMPLGPSMACNIFGGRPCDTPWDDGALHSNETDCALAGRDNEAYDVMDIEIASDGGGPWRHARPQAPTKGPESSGHATTTGAG